LRARSADDLAVEAPCRLGVAVDLGAQAAAGTPLVSDSPPTPSSTLTVSPTRALRAEIEAGTPGAPERHMDLGDGERATKFLGR